MQPGGGHAKGAQFEREICERLSRWVEPKTDDTLFWRSAMSGGRATVRGRKGKKDSQSGDLTCTAAAGAPLVSVFSIECKFVKELAIDSALLHGKGPLAAYWAQASGDAIDRNKKPLLIAKQNRLPILAFMRHSDAQPYFGMASQIELGRFFRLDGYRVSMYLLDDLLRMPYVRSRFSG